MVREMESTHLFAVLLIGLCLQVTWATAQKYLFVCFICNDEKCLKVTTIYDHGTNKNMWVRNATTPDLMSCSVSPSPPLGGCTVCVQDPKVYIVCSNGTTKLGLEANDHPITNLTHINECPELKGTPLEAICDLNQVDKPLPGYAIILIGFIGFVIIIIIIGIIICSRKCNQACFSLSAPHPFHSIYRNGIHKYSETSDSAENHDPAESCHT